MTVEHLVVIEIVEILKNNQRGGDVSKGQRSQQEDFPIANAGTI